MTENLANIFQIKPSHYSLSGDFKTNLIENQPQ